MKDLLKNLQEIYSIMLKNKIEQIEVKLGNYNLKIKRFNPKKDILQLQQINFYKETFSLKEQQKEEKQEQKLNGEEIVSPLNGVFYRSPSPGAAPFVNEGDIVNPGSVLCIIEAMKVMNEIKADKKCRILKILCENGANVSLGTKLFIVEPL